MDNYADMTDAQLAAEFSIHATKAGRLELAEALLRVAMQAHRAERRPEMVDVPFAGHTRHEAPRLTVAREMLEPVQPDLGARINAEGPGATAVIPMPTGDQVSSNEGARCSAKVLKGNVYAECHGAVVWMPATSGGPATPFVEAHWAHVDRALEQDHQAQV